MNLCLPSLLLHIQNEPNENLRNQHVNRSKFTNKAYVLMFKRRGIVCLFNYEHAHRACLTINNGTSKRPINHRRASKEINKMTGVIWYVIYIYNLRLGKTNCSLVLPGAFVVLLFMQHVQYIYIHRASSSRLRNPAVRSSYSFLNLATRASSPSAGSSNFWELS
jgi:hypothetical protein